MQNDKSIDCPFEKMFGSELNRDDLYFMKNAYNEALLAWDKGEVPVGAVIECDGKIIAKAHNLVETLKDPLAHAEVLAISKASNFLQDWRLNECTLYVTKEPCPMCSGALVMARIKRVVYAVSDEAMGCLGGKVDLSQIDTFNHSMIIKKDVLKEESKELIQTFFKQKRKLNKEEKSEKKAK